ncbi:D-3-phosphoglycerate dehydrogenase like protein [Argiope bruennichi]|uniref:D-3-phosphoglycerate dehydrogenase like protein n=1 Tax=Argiope bruennichi TaxID=94029 RepID=A0A8T0FMC5_ARGBR|nr:D-3-phosphoglycerate dehydrogenase like protein [Argiope bruennichi]
MYLATLVRVYKSHIAISTLLTDRFFLNRVMVLGARKKYSSSTVLPYPSVMNFEKGVLIPEPVDPKCVEILQDIDIPVVVKVGLKPDELKKEIKTIGFDPLVPAEESKKFNVESMELEKIWLLADYITVHTPLIPQTTNMINEAVFAKCRKGVKIINCARGGIVDETALLAALKSGQCGGAGLDVYTQEPPKCTELLQHPKVICTPHLGASTYEAQCRVAEEIAQQFVSLHRGQPIHGIVNSPAYSLSRLHGQWAKISKTLGAFISMLFTDFDKTISVTVNVYGRELQKKEPLFATAVLMGILKQRCGIDANYVNAVKLGRERGFQVTKVINNHISLDSVSVELTATGITGTHSILGTLNNGEPALCNIDNCQFKTVPYLSNDLVFVKGSNANDLMLKVFGILALNNLVHNIAWAERPKDSEGSWCVLQTRGKVEEMPDEVIEQIKSARRYVDFWQQLQL